MRFFSYDGILHKKPSFELCLSEVLELISPKKENVEKVDSIIVGDKEGLGLYPDRNEPKGCSNSPQLQNTGTSEKMERAHPETMPQSDPFSSEISSLLDAEFSETRSENELVPFKVKHKFSEEKTKTILKNSILILFRYLSYCC